MKLIARVSIFLTAVLVVFSYLFFPTPVSASKQEALDYIKNSEMINEVWGILKGVGFSDKQAAAIMGNWHAYPYQLETGNTANSESSLNPVKHNNSHAANFSSHCTSGGVTSVLNCGERNNHAVGFAQLLEGSRLGEHRLMPMLYIIDDYDHNLITKYFDHPETYSVGVSGTDFYNKLKEAGSLEDARNLYRLEAQFTYDEIYDYQKIANQIASRTSNRVISRCGNSVFKANSDSTSAYDMASSFDKCYENGNHEIPARYYAAELYYEALNGTSGGAPTGGGTTPGTGTGTTQDPATTKWFAKNGIIFYQRYDCIPKTTTTGEDTTTSVLSSSELSTINSRKSLYETAVEGTSVPWELLTAYVYWNEHWTYQDTHSWSSSDATNPTVLKSSAELINQYLEGTDENSIKHSIFMYFINDVYGNPTSLSFYTTQATNLGYTEIQASNGDGCPFVVNRLDPQRDPSSGSFVGTDKWQYSSNDFSGTPPSPGSEYGVFVLYTAIKNAPATTTGSSDDDYCIRPTGGTTTISAGTMEQITITTGGTATSARDIQGDWYTVKVAATGYNMFTYSEWLMDPAGGNLKQPYTGEGSNRCDLYASAIQCGIVKSGLSAHLRDTSCNSGYSTRNVSTVAEVLTIFYEELQKGHPIYTRVSASVALSTRASANHRHFVTVVGMKTTADPNNLKPSDFLIQDNYDLKHLADSESVPGRYLYPEGGTYLARVVNI